MQTPNYYTDTQQVYRHPATIQTPNWYTDTQLLYRNTMVRENRMVRDAPMTRDAQMTRHAQIIKIATKWYAMPRFELKLCHNAAKYIE